MAERPSIIAHWSEIEEPEGPGYGSDEIFDIDAPFSDRFALTRIGIHHVRLLPGRRTSYPHAESAEEEFVYVIFGEPDVWLDGRLHRLKPGDAVGFPAGDGLAHTFINNTGFEAHLLVVGERPKDENKIVYPLNPERKPLREDWWHDAPARDLGAHDGLPDELRAKRGRPSRP